MISLVFNIGVIVATAIGTAIMHLKARKEFGSVAAAPMLTRVEVVALWCGFVLSVVLFVTNLSESAAAEEKFVRTSNELLKATQKAERAESHASKAGTDVQELKQKASPRRITPEQTAAFTNFFANHADAPRGKIFVRTEGSDFESMQYLNDLIAILNSAGFTPVQQTSISIPADPNRPSGLFLSLKDLAACPLHAPGLIKGFQASGISFMIATNAKTASDRLTLLVGKK